jgi:hypothetical protein
MSTELWEKLNSYSNAITEKFDKHFTRFDNPKYDMKFDGWVDLFWSSDKIQKCHLKTIQPVDGKGLWLMHINIFPKENIELPILGFDIVAGPNKITGSFMDFSPLHGFPHPYHEYMEIATKELQWNKPRELPEWAKNIFSEDMIAAGNIKDGWEVDQLIAVTKDLVNFYLYNLEDNAFKSTRQTKDILNNYCINQKKNPHLHRSILAMGISEEDKDKYVNNVLFEEI